MKKETRVYCEAVTLHVHVYDEKGLPDRRKPMADVTPDLIFQVANGFMAAKHPCGERSGAFEAWRTLPRPWTTWHNARASPGAPSGYSPMRWWPWGFWSGGTRTGIARSLRPSERAHPGPTCAQPYGTGIASIIIGGPSSRRWSARSTPSLGRLRLLPRNNPSTQQASKPSPPGPRGRSPPCMTSVAIAGC